MRQGNEWGKYACDYTTKHNAKERANTVYLLCTVTYTVFTWQTAPQQHSFKSPKEKAIPKDEDGRQGPWTFINVEPG